ncbi:MAG: hypothetical protein IJX19_01610 [Clostridia bacterium]|nr:hypothetical protein [Clostridia bacterium]
MKGTSNWSYAPYRPLLTDVGEIYICRVAPGVNSVELEWLPLEPNTVYTVHCRKRDGGDFTVRETTQELSCLITDLDTDTDYEFYLSSGEKKSRVRLARCGKGIGDTVNYLHPDDEAYSFSGRYLCSPSLVRHPEGYLLASMDVYAANHPQNLTFIFRSDDDGKSWHYVSELMPCFWGKLFVHRGELYMLACSTEYGDLLIGKSTDGGKTFSAPVTLLRGSNGKNGNTGVHKNPQNIFHHGGRIYETLEWGAWADKSLCHAAMVMSCDENDDLLNPESWRFTEPVKFGHFAPELEHLPIPTMTIEGTLTRSPEGKLLNIMRFGSYHKAIVYEVNTEDRDAPLTYSRCMEFPANYSKFMIKHDERSGCYYSVATRTCSPEDAKHRNLLSLLSSKDLMQWDVVCDLFDYRDQDPKLVGFQYVDFEIEGDDLIYLCRTALNGANSYHNSNYITFHRVKNFRDLTAND